MVTAIYWEMTSDNGIIIIIIKKTVLRRSRRKRTKGEGTTVAARTLAGPEHRRRGRLSHDFRISPCI